MTDESFAALLEESLGGRATLEGTVVEGVVIAIDNDIAVIDIGLKAEGRVALKEFTSESGQPSGLRVGDTVEVYVDRIEGKDGEALLSRDKAKREEAWRRLEKQSGAGERVNGVIFGRVKGGFTVDFNGIVAFLPGSQVDIRPVRDVTPLMNTQQPFQILKMDRSRGNVVVSRRAVLEETRAEQRAELVASLREGQVLDGVVKNITDYGAFVDLGGVDGLLHVTDMSWRRVGHPSEVLAVGETVKVQVVRFNTETQRISLGMKQLQADPWDGVEIEFPKGARFNGVVTNIIDYGAFVELKPGVEGLVHVSEMSWVRKNVHPGKIVSSSQGVEVMVLGVDPVKHRISLGLKQCQDNPWESIPERFPIDSVIEGEIRNITEFGLFVALDSEIDGMVHMSDLDWEASPEQALANYKKGDVIKVKVLEVDRERNRVSLGVKQLTADPFDDALGGVQRGAVVTGTVVAAHDNGVEVLVNDSVPGFIRKGDLSRDRSEQHPDRFAKGEKVDAKVIDIDRVNRKVILSIKAYESDQTKEAMASYGSPDSGALLGDILGRALQEKAARTEEE